MRLLGATRCLFVDAWTRDSPSCPNLDLSTRPHHHRHQPVTLITLIPSLTWNRAQSKALAALKLTCAVSLHTRQNSPPGALPKRGLWFCTPIGADSVLLPRSTCHPTLHTQYSVLTVYRNHRRKWPRQSLARHAVDLQPGDSCFAPQKKRCGERRVSAWSPSPVWHVPGLVSRLPRWPLILSV